MHDVYRNDVTNDARDAVITARAHARIARVAREKAMRRSARRSARFWAIVAAIAVVLALSVVCAAASILLTNVVFF